MAGFGRLIFSIDFNKLLCSRSKLLNFYQNVSQNTLNSAHETAIPQKPKKPQTAFIMYLNQVRQKILDQSPNIKASEVVKRASLEWSDLDVVQKENLRNQYKKNYEVYVKELQKFEDSLTNEQKKLLKERRKSQRSSDISLSDKQTKRETFGKPKRPLNAFLLYILSKKNEKDQNVSYKNWLQLMATNWREMPNAEKDSYVTQTTELMTQYREDLLEWEEKMLNLGHSNIVRHQTLAKFRSKKK